MLRSRPAAAVLASALLALGACAPGSRDQAKNAARDAAPPHLVSDQLCRALTLQAARTLLPGATRSHERDPYFDDLCAYVDGRSRVLLVAWPKHAQDPPEPRSAPQPIPAAWTSAATPVPAPYQREVTSRADRNAATANWTAGRWEYGLSWESEGGIPADAEGRVVAVARTLPELP